VALEEKNCNQEQEIKELKRIVRNIRTDLDHVSAELQIGNSQDDSPTQHDASLQSNYRAYMSKRPSRLFPLQLQRYIEV